MRLQSYACQSDLAFPVSVAQWHPFRTFRARISFTDLAMGQTPVPPVNIPIPTKIGSKMGGAPTPKWDPDPQPSDHPSGISRVLRAMLFGHAATEDQPQTQVPTKSEGLVSGLCIRGLPQQTSLGIKQARSGPRFLCRGTGWGLSQHVGPL